MEFIAKLKKLERAWKEQYITATEYHREIDYFLRKLAVDERGAA